jgi:hypothetical protein
MLAMDSNASHTNMTAMDSNVIQEYGRIVVIKKGLFLSSVDYDLE